MKNAGGLIALLFAWVGYLTATHSEAETYDPLQKVNRPVETFNDELDERLFKPIADGYVVLVPKAVRGHVTSFFSNVGYLNTILNDLLQGKFKQGCADSGRFVVNTTLGVGGLFDPASSMGLAMHDEDFGQTLGVWGRDPGAYLTIPVAGPSSFRDAPALGVAAITNLLFYVPSLAITAPLTLLSGIDKRANADTDIKFRNEAALDPYVFTREAYLQYRTFQIYDGNPPVDDSLFDVSTQTTSQAIQAPATFNQAGSPPSSAWRIAFGFGPHASGIRHAY